MKLYAFHCGGELTDMSLFDPFHPEVGTRVTIPYFAYLVEHSEGRVLFDSGGHPDLINDPEKRLGAAAEDFEVVMEQGDDIVSRLSTIGVSPSDVKHVVHSHLHYDHAGGVEFFPDSIFYVQERELQFAYWPPVYQRELYLKADFDHDVNWKQLEGDYDVFGDGKVVLFPTPGHTAGHQSMVVRLDGSSVLLTADAAMHARTLEEKALPAIHWSAEAMVSSWRRIEDLARRENAELIFTHDLEYPSKTKIAPEAFYE